MAINWFTVDALHITIGEDLVMHWLRPKSLKLRLVRVSCQSEEKLLWIPLSSEFTSEGDKGRQFLVGIWSLKLLPCKNTSLRKFKFPMGEDMDPANAGNVSLAWSVDTIFIQGCVVVCGFPPNAHFKSRQPCGHQVRVLDFDNKIPTANIRDMWLMPQSDNPLLFLPITIPTSHFILEGHIPVIFLAPYFFIGVMEIEAGEYVTKFH